ncbi:MAG: glycosyltransferase domain-containing protein [Actinomycetes bacterium]
MERAVVTALVAGYEPLGEQPIAARSDLRFVCVTDDPTLTSDTWEIRVVEPAFPRDPVRSARRIKALLHEYAPEFDETLFIDNAITLRELPETVLDAALADHDLALVRHSSRATLADEFLVVADDGLDDPARVYEQFMHYSALHPAVLETRPYSAGFIARRRSARVEATMRTWFDHQLRYSRRDQLSLNVALAIHGITPTVLELDNADNPLFRSDSPPGRRGERRTGASCAAMRPPAVEIRAVEARVAELEARVVAAETMNAELIDTLAEVQAALEAERADHATTRTAAEDARRSISWRLTAPLRALRRR